MYLNTDISNYFKEYTANGLPKSTVRTREFQHNFGSFRDAVLQYPPNKEQLDFLISEKDHILSKSKNRYHQSMLSNFESVAYAKIIRRYIPEPLQGDPSEPLFDLLRKIPCDVVVFGKGDDGRYETRMVHLVFPNGWGADEAIRQPFGWFHSGITNTQGRSIVPDTDKFVEFFMSSDRIFERVGAFNFRSSSRLDRHPIDMHETVFENMNPIYIRFERQVIVGVPEMNSFLFFIHTNLIDFRAMPDAVWNAIVKADPDCHSRKVLHKHQEYFLNYLNQYRNQDVSSEKS